MPASKRIVLPGLSHHVVQRGNNKSNIFEDNKDYDTYQALLCKFLVETGCHLLAYALLPNHVHLLVRPPERESLPRLMLKLNVTYVKYFQERYQVTGHMFESRYKSYPIEDDEYLWRVVRYIDTNPKKAGLIRQAHKYQFSSAAAHLAGQINGIITHLPFEATDLDAFAEYLVRPGKKEELAQIQESLKRNKPLGSRTFLNHIAGLFGIKFRFPGRGRPKNN